MFTISIFKSRLEYRKHLHQRILIIFVSGNNGKLKEDFYCRGKRGIWIRPRAGAKKRMWKKSPAQRRRCKTHVFTNATQSNLLDKMVSYASLLHTSRIG